MQQQRRTNPYPTTWEIPVGILTAGLVAVFWGIHVGRGVATVLAGHGWTWPDFKHALNSVPGVLAGDVHAGLTAGALPEAATAPVLVGVLAVEVLLIGGMIAASVWGWDRWGPARMLGMATPTQVEEVLGVARLRQVRHIIRPDLYPKKKRGLR